MKIIEAINQKLEHFDADAPDEVKNGLPTFQKQLVNVLVSSQAKDGDEALDLYRVALSIKGAADSVILEEADFRLLEARVRANSVGLLSFYHAQVILKLKSAKEAPRAA
jgi:hypothetical protein